MSDEILPGRAKSSLTEVLMSQEQRGAELWQQAVSTMEHAKHLLTEETALDGESHFLVTPWQTPNDGVLSGSRYSKEYLKTGDKDLDSQRYAIAARVNKGAKAYSRGCPLYLVMNGNVTNARLQFDSFTDGLTVMDSLYGVVSDESVKTIVAGISANVDQLARERSQKIAQERRHKNGRRAWIVAGVLLVGGVYEGINAIVTAADHGAANHRAKIAAYDSRHVQLGADAVRPEFFAVSQPSDFSSYIPKLTHSRIETSPRSFNLDAGTCRSVGTIGTRSTVRVVTNAPVGDVSIDVTGNSTVEVCAPEDKNVDSNHQPTYKMAIQEVK